MEETARLWIKDVGYPICVAVAMMWMCWKLLDKNTALMEKGRTDDKEAAEKLQLATQLAADRVYALTLDSNKALERNAKCTDENTGAVKSLADQIKKFGSDPSKLCKASEIVDCKAEETMERIVRHFGAKANGS